MKSFAFVFPGQGSQSVGMLDGWAGHPAVLDTVREASDALGEDIGALIAQGPKESLAPRAVLRPWQWPATRWVNIRRWSPLA